MPHVGGRLKRAIRKALFVDPARRFKTPSEFASDLESVEIKYDWQATFDPNGEVTWLGDRSDAASIQVKLLKDGSNWKTEVFTIGSKKVQRKDKTSAWKSGISRADAFNHLSSYFASLE